jgi:hypothetical protein
VNIKHERLYPYYFTQRELQIELNQRLFKEIRNSVNLNWKPLERNDSEHFLDAHRRSH